MRQMFKSDDKDKVTVLEGRVKSYSKYNRRKILIMQSIVKRNKQTCSTGALSSINGAARLINEASPTPTSLQKQEMQ